MTHPGIVVPRCDLVEQTDRAGLLAEPLDGDTSDPCIDVGRCDLREDSEEEIRIASLPAKR